MNPERQGQPCVVCAVLQSLDYDNSENQLFLEEERRINHTVSLGCSVLATRPALSRLVLLPGLGTAISHSLRGPQASDSGATIHSTGLCPGARDTNTGHGVGVGVSGACDGEGHAELGAWAVSYQL